MTNRWDACIQSVLLSSFTFHVYSHSLLWISYIQYVWNVSFIRMGMKMFQLLLPDWGTLWSSFLTTSYVLSWSCPRCWDFPPLQPAHTILAPIKQRVLQGGRASAVLSPCLHCCIVVGNAQRKHIWVWTWPRLLVLGWMRRRCSPAVNVGGRLICVIAFKSTLASSLDE